MGPQDRGRADRNRDLVSPAAFQSDLMPHTPSAPCQTSLQLGYADEHELGKAHSEMLSWRGQSGWPAPLPGKHTCTQHGQKIEGRGVASVLNLFSNSHWNALQVPERESHSLGFCCSGILLSPWRHWGNPTGYPKWRNTGACTLVLLLLD